MEKLGKYITYDDEFLSNAMLFLGRYQLLDIDTKCLILEVIKNNEMVKNLFSKYLLLDIVSDAKVITPEKMELKEIIELANNIFILLFPSYKTEILKYDDLIYFYDDFPISFSCFDYQISDSNVIVPDEIELSSNFNEYSIGVINHEKMHVLMLEKVLLKKFPGIYMELLSMLIQKISNYVVETETNSKKTILIDSIIRATDNQQQINTLDYLQEIDLSSESANSYFVFQYLNLKANDYLISEWYSELLFKYYMDDSKKLILKLNEVLTNEISIQELLNYYQVSLDNNELFSCMNNKLEEVKKYILKP